VQEQLGEALVGTRSRWATDRSKFPLLVKLLDANRALSVQVHPPDEYALEHEGGELGKTEMWYVLYAEPDAQLVYGLSQQTTAGAFRRALREGTLADLLHYLPIQKGDAIFVPTGTIHALLEGAVVAEIQQNSDTTYRVYDWGRLGADGKPRPLHVDKAVDVIDFGMVRPKAYEPVVVHNSGGVRRAEISRCPYFCVEKVDLDGGTTYEGRCDGGTFEIWGSVVGQADIQWTGQPVTLPAVRFALLPAALCAFAIHAKQPATLLRAYAPL
jgi:mannose-6-phosphate isomerase